MGQRGVFVFTLAVSCGFLIRVLATAVLVHAVRGLSIRPLAYRWDSPCSGSRTVKISAFSSTTPKVPEIKRKIVRLKNKYEVFRFGNRDHPDTLEIYTLPGLLVLDMSKKDNLDIPKTFQDIYQQLSHIAVFLNEAQSDEREEEYEGGYANDFEQLEEDNYWLLCKLKQSMTSRKIPYSRVVTPTVMSNALRKLRGAKRHNRDYILIRDYGKVLDYINQVWNYLRKRPKIISWWYQLVDRFSVR